MINENAQKKEEKQDNNKGDLKSDPETLNTTDPQEHMKGPVSSLVRKLGEDFDDKDAEKQVQNDKNIKKE